MSEDKNTKEIKEEKKVDKKSAGVKVEKKQDKGVELAKDKKSDKKDNNETEKNFNDISIEKDSMSEIRNQMPEMEELPEEVRKKIEKRKAERSKKGAISKKKSKMIRKQRKKGRKEVTVGKAFIKSTYNNTIVTLTDLNGDVISWASAGIAGFKGPKKATPYAAQIITRIAVEKAKEVGLSEVSVFVKGVGTGRESAVRALNASGLNVSLIKDVTPIPHNGCRKRKPRRV